MSGGPVPLSSLLIDKLAAEYQLIVDWLTNGTECLSDSITNAYGYGWGPLELTEAYLPVTSLNSPSFAPSFDIISFKIFS